MKEDRMKTKTKTENVKMKAGAKDSKKKIVMFGSILLLLIRVVQLFKSVLKSGTRKD